MARWLDLRPPMQSARWEEIYRKVLSDVREDGSAIHPRRGEAKERIAYAFQIPNPRDRCLLSEARRFSIFQGVGHWLWIMGGRMDLSSITYYNPRAERFSVDLRKLDGAYGPRLFGLGALNQIPNVIELIRGHSDTRRAVAAVYLPEFDSWRSAVDGREDEVPCTVALQFLPRGDRLDAVTYMRSQDGLMVLPYDIFIFTLLQEYVSASVGLRPGTYHHVAGSLHYYVKDSELLEKVLADSTQAAPLMPEMPSGEQSTYLGSLMELEESIRVSCTAHMNLPGRTEFNPRDFVEQASELPEFWKAIALALVAWAAIRLSHEKTLARIREIVPRPFDIYVDRALASISRKAKRSLEAYVGR